MPHEKSYLVAPDLKLKIDMEWGEPWPVMLLTHVTGRDSQTGLVVRIPRAYLLHRVDLEKVKVMKAAVDRCSASLGECRDREQLPAFWDSDIGKVVLVGIGAVSAAAVATGIVLLAQTSQ